MNTISFEYMKYNGRSLKKMGGREGITTEEAILNRERLCKTEWFI